jgi:hypothetical protein
LWIVGISSSLKKAPPENHFNNWMKFHITSLHS